MNEGEFVITVRVQNKGDVELENLIIKDTIPSGFSLSEFHPPAGTTYETVQEGGASILQLKMDILKGNDTLILNFKCTGTGDYPRSEPQVVVLGRGGSAVSSGPSSEGATEAAPEVELSYQKASATLEVFQNIFKKLDSAPKVSDFSAFLDKLRDELPPGPVRHKFSGFIRDLQNLEDQNKIIVGSLYDEFRAKLKDWQSTY